MKSVTRARPVKNGSSVAHILTCLFSCTELTPLSLSKCVEVSRKKYEGIIN